MADRKDKILVIDSDANERTALVDGALTPFGYEVQVADDGGTGLSMILANRPDLLVLDLKTPGLTAADLMAALNAQSLDIPVVVITNPGEEKDALHAFRLGVKDYIVRPVRDTELIQVIERLMKDIRIRRDRETLVGEVKAASGEAENRLREMRTLMSIGKAVTASRNPDEVYDRVIRAAIQLTKAEAVGIYLLDGETKQLILKAGQNLSRKLLDRVGQPVEDSLAPLVINSREVYAASGPGLKNQFRPAQENVIAVIYAPMVVQDSAVGILWVANSKSEFEPHMKEIMTVLSDYAAIAVVNAHLFNTMQANARQLEAAHKQTQGQAGGAPGALTADRETLGKLRSALTHLMGSMNLFRTGEMGRLPAAQQAAVDVMHREIEGLVAQVDALMPHGES